jgi:murein DD-endopeptidase MepM/ murein hydrolase activator NlpD
LSVRAGFPVLFGRAHGPHFLILLRGLITVFEFVLALSFVSVSSNFRAFLAAAFARSGGTCRRAACVALLAVLAACSSTTAPPAGKSPAYYHVKEGDTLARIAQQQNQSTADLLRWNKLSDESQVSPGMLLRVQPPFGGAAGKGGAGNGSQAAGKAGGKHARTTPGAPASAPVRGISLVWPAQGKLQSGYDGNNSKGLVITNAVGTPVVAAAAGTVAYANSGLRGYGNLVIVRHNNDFLTIYAHNSKLLVKQGDRVSQGQRIAEMGSTDAKRVELYFELRQGSQPVNPMGVLPRR